MQVQLQVQIAANLLPSRGWACNTIGLWMTTFDHMGLMVATSWDPTQVDCSHSQTDYRFANKWCLINKCRWIASMLQLIWVYLSHLSATRLWQVNGELDSAGCYLNVFWLNSYIKVTVLHPVFWKNFWILFFSNSVDLPLTTYWMYVILNVCFMTISVFLNGNRFSPLWCNLCLDIQM